jgi:SAM-dependent methyltransferase
MDRKTLFLTEFYPEARFGGFSDIDGTIAFYARVNALLTPTATVVDYGCGRGAYGNDRIPFRRSLRILKGKAGRVIGLDVDPYAAQNPFVDEFHLLECVPWPLPAGCAQLVVCDNVLEHLAEPAEFFGEATRILAPGGTLCLRTPNAWGYVALMSRLIPNQAHGQVVARVKPGSQAQDIFPTRYRCNSLPAIRRMLARFGLQGTVYGYAGEPAYMAFSRLAYALGVLHQRLAPGFLRSAIFAFAMKEEESPAKDAKI